MNWFAIKVAGIRRWGVDILMVVFLVSAVVSAVVLAYFATH